jgi:membrane dipeptidase
MLATTRRALIAGAAATLAAAPALAARTKPARPFSERQARAVHARLHTLDSHLDTPANVARPGFDIFRRNDWIRDFSQVDVPRMREGGLDGGFFVVYQAQGPRNPAAHQLARDAGLRRIAVIREMVAARTDTFQLALKADDFEPIAKAGKIAVFISMENSYPIGQDLSLLRTFYDLGLRMAGPVHFLNNDLGDSSTDKPEFNGLSALGKDWVRECNRLGIIVDHSHASDPVFDDMIAISSVPIIASHSSCKTIYDHPRNLDDARLKLLAAKGGVLQMNAFGAYLEKLPDPSPARAAGLKALQDKYGPPNRLAADRLQAYRAELVALNLAHPAPQASFETLMRHLMHAIDLMGVDHVGIGLDWDGGGGVAGLEDVSKIWKITQALLNEGFGEADLQKIWGGNLMRVMRAVEAGRTAPA